MSAPHERRPALLVLAILLFATGGLPFGVGLYLSIGPLFLKGCTHDSYSICQSATAAIQYLGILLLLVGAVSISLGLVALRFSRPRPTSTN